MNVFRRNVRSIEGEKKKKEDEELQLEKLRKSNLGMKDIVAIFVAMIQIILPFALGIVFIYFVVIEFITKVWFRY